jgi:hypothetical protein
LTVMKRCCTVRSTLHDHFLSAGACDSFYHVGPARP